jgi:hypothetical protein
VIPAPPRTLASSVLLDRPNLARGWLALIYVAAKMCETPLCPSAPP